jgi:hypothetical protein
MILIVKWRRHAPNDRIVGAGADKGMEQEKVGDRLNTGLNALRALVAKDRDHEAAGAGGGIGPGLGEGAEMRAGIDDALDDGEEVEGRSGQAVDAGHDDRIALGYRSQKSLELRAVGASAARLFTVDLRAAGSRELLDLRFKGLPMRADTGVAVQKHFQGG